MKNVVFIQRLIPHYRLSFFKKLKYELAKDGFNLKVVHSGSKELNDDCFLYVKPILFWKLNFLRNQLLVITPRLFSILIKIKPSFILTEDISNLPNGLIVMFYTLFIKTHYGIVGLGKILGKKMNIVKVFVYPLIYFFRKRASCFIAYSSAGKDYYEKNYLKAGYSWSNSVANPVDMKVINEREFGRGLNLVYIGRIEEFKRLELLLRSFMQIGNKNIYLHILGDGSRRKDLQSAYRSSRIYWHGNVFDELEKHKILNKCHLGIMPGSGGLAIQELQAHGIPVITSYSDGTELDLVKSINKNLFMEKITTDALTKKISEYYSLSNEEKRELSFSAYEIVRGRYNVENMVKITRKVVNKWSS